MRLWRPLFGSGFAVLLPANQEQKPAHRLNWLTGENTGEFRIKIMACQGHWGMKKP